MKTEIIKELRYAIRSGRAIILFASFLFFALLTPVMLKVVLPMVLSGGMAEGIDGLIDMTQRGCIQNYMDDVLQIGTIIISFSLCSLTASEIKDNTWVLPVCTKKSFGQMIGAKLLVFGLLMVIIPIISLFVDYGYSGLLFGFEIGFMPILYAGLLQGIYILFLLSCLIMWGILLKKPIAAGFSTLAIAFGMHFISSLLKIQKWTPTGLLVHANKLKPDLSLELIIPFAMTVLLIILMIFISLLQLRNMEWNTRKE